MPRPHRPVTPRRGRAAGAPPRRWPPLLGRVLFVGVHVLPVLVVGVHVDGGAAVPGFLPNWSAQTWRVGEDIYLAGVASVVAIRVPRHRRGPTP